MGYSRILLVKNNYKTLGYDFYDAAFPSLALEYIAAYVEEISGVTIQILDAKAEDLSLKQVKNRIQNFNPDLVGLTVPVTSAIVSVMKVAKIAKNLGATVVLGGWHPTLAVEDTLDKGADIVVRGEGELTFKELIEKGTPVGINGLSYRDNGTYIHNPDREFIKNLDDLKFPARHLRSKNGNYGVFHLNMDSIETSRGCMNRCKFCSTHIVYRGKWRYRSVPSIMEELIEIGKNKKVTDVFFIDDNILVDMKRVKKLSIEIIKAKSKKLFPEKLRFFFQGRLDLMAKYPHIIKLMGQAGFWLVLVGIEAVTEKALKSINKGATLDQMRAGIKALHDAGIIILGNTIIGANLDATVQDELYTIRYVAENLDLDFASFTILTPFPGTILCKEMEEQNLVLTKDYSKYNWLNPVIRTNKLSPTTLKRLLFRGFYAVNYYGRGKFGILKRAIRSRGITFILNLNRILTGWNAYQTWKNVVKLEIFGTTRAQQTLYNNPILD
ncbi:MAG: B12-binding domain-containing radical SAM protein [Candidatus Helarchaeota archaeon]|nr:B12-binding domain-containing radical SAM protein [Candidatus Helarchaeota archaeon]